MRLRFSDAGIIAYKHDRDEIEQHSLVRGTHSKPANIQSSELQARTSVDMHDTTYPFFRDRNGNPIVEHVMADL